MPCRSLRPLAARSGVVYIDGVVYEEFVACLGRQLSSCGAARGWTATNAEGRLHHGDPSNTGSPSNTKSSSIPQATAFWDTRIHRTVLFDRAPSLPGRAVDLQSSTRAGKRAWGGVDWCGSRDFSSNSRYSSTSTGFGSLNFFPDRHHLVSSSCQLGRSFSSIGDGSDSGSSGGEQGTTSAAASGNQHDDESADEDDYDEDVHRVELGEDDDDAQELEDEIACSLPDFRHAEDFSLEGLTPEQQQHAWQEGTLLLAQLKAHLIERLKVERAEVVSGAAGISEEEAQAMEGMEVELSDEDARRLLRYALGSKLTQTHEKMIGALGTVETEGICTAVALLVQIAEQSKGCLWELQVSDLLEPDAQLKFFRSMLLWKLATDTPEATPSDEAVAAAIGPEASVAAMDDAIERYQREAGAAAGDEDGTQRRASRASAEERDGDGLTVDDSTLARCFTLFQDTTGAVTLQEFGAMEELLVNATVAGSTMTYHDIIAPEGPATLMRVMLAQLLAFISDATRTRMLDMLRGDVMAHRASVERGDSDEPVPPDSMLLFLSDNMPLLLGCGDSHRDSVLSGLLDAYELQSQPVKREFIPPAPGELPPEIAHSPMKPLSQEISHRITMLVNLYQPQRVAWGAYVDLTKVVRPMRAKNLMKRFKYDNPVPNHDVW